MSGLDDRDRRDGGPGGAPDIRAYVWVLVFRWKLIALCFFYFLLGGVIYLRLARKEYYTSCKVMVYSEPMLTMPHEGTRWTSLPLHSQMLRDPKLRDRIVRRMEPEWGRKVGNREDMSLAVSARPTAGYVPMLIVSARSAAPAYAEAFLAALIEEHRVEWQDIQGKSRDQAAAMLETELYNLKEQIKGAEDAVIEYMRLHDIPRMKARSSMESEYLAGLMRKRNTLTTEMMLMEATTPELKDAGVGVISEVGRLTRETSELEPEPVEVALAEPGAGGGRSGSSVEMKVGGARKGGQGDQSDEERGWRDLRVKLAGLMEEEKELAADLKPEHPRVKEARRQIADILRKLAVAKEVALGRLKDRHDSLMIHLKAVESAEYKWSARNVLAAQYQAEYKRFVDVVGRYERNYDTLYGRLHGMRVAEELKAEHFSVPDPPSTGGEPVWPDPKRILFMVLALGLGSGLGLAFVAQILDNKVQTVADVEQALGVPFLGGVPHWVRGGIEMTVRPMVTEEQSSGAVEAYRALRTTLLAALGKAGEKIVLFTSTESREGKTLTVLNLAASVAQMGKRVLLLDMDLRRGRLHRSLGEDKEPGMNDALKDGLPLKDLALQTKVANLHLVPAGSSMENTPELLQTRDLAGMLNEAARSYDYVFVDTPPVLRVTDTVLAATRGAGVVVYVTRVNKTPKPMIKYALGMLADARIIGMILNDIEMHRISSLYYTYQYPAYAYYSSAYRYGYDYYNYEDKGARRGVLGRMGGGGRARRAFGRWLRRTFLPME